MTSERPETGPMRFGDDCRGVFLRGDNACDYAMQLEAALDPRNGPEMRALFAAQLQPLVALLHGANEFVEAPGEQVLRSFAACVGPDPRTPRLPTMALDDATLAAIARRPTPDVTALLDEVRRLTMECDARMVALEAMSRAPAAAWREDAADAERAAADGKEVVSVDELLRRAEACDATTDRGHVLAVVDSLRRAVGVLRRRSDERATLNAAAFAAADSFQRSAAAAQAEVARLRDNLDATSHALDDARARLDDVAAALALPPEWDAEWGDRVRARLSPPPAGPAELDLDAIDRKAARLLDGITAEPWKLSLVHGVPMLYGADGVAPVAFTIYEETASADGCPEADANAALIEAAPVLARHVRDLVARVAALVWAVLDERRMKAQHRAALREEISAAVFDTDSDRENAAMAESRETADAAEAAAARLDDLLRGGAPNVVPADVVRRYVDAVDALRRAGVMPSSDHPARARMRDAQAELINAFVAAGSPAPVTDALAIRLAEALTGTLPGVPAQVGAGEGELVVYVPTRARVPDDAVPVVFEGVSVRVVRLGPVAPAAGGAPR